MMFKQADIRNIFYSYFLKHNHRRVLSAPLVPAKDPTLLFTNAGMNQFKDLFLNKERREYTRAVSIQKCLRVSGKHNDFDEVGKTDFHHTFFEMMGNFSFGDYFKAEAIAYAWELLTGLYQLPPEKLWITIHRDDDEAFRIWRNQIGIPENRIKCFGEKDNFWQMGETGPCGPCSEIHYDRGEGFGPVEFGEGNSRYIEIWNLVFMQYFRDETGNLNPLPQPSIDTGMGMERLSTVLENVRGNYQTDLFKPIINFTAELADIDPAESQHAIDLNVIADHSRALTFLIADGIMPANDGRGYVLRRILRRAIKHGKTLINDPFLYRISSKVIEVMNPFYPELDPMRQFIAEVIRAEEERFNQTLDNGLKIFLELAAKSKEGDQAVIPGNELFKLSDTYGFPIDFARDLAVEQGLNIDLAGYHRELEKQRERSRINLMEKRREISALPGSENFDTSFIGYEQVQAEVELRAIYIDRQPVSEIKKNQRGILIFDRTPFYAESGGQIGDRGTGKSENAYLIIEDTKKLEGGAFLHMAHIENGTLKIAERLLVEVDRTHRQNTAVHHTSTHLLHAALREVLGLHVKQAGSYVGPEKLRFDFTHFKALSEEEVGKVEKLANEKIRENLEITPSELNYDDAIRSGAMALFEEKYSEKVRVIDMGDFSKELCGGTHLETTGQIGLFKILNESSISSGIRRIEALAGSAAFHYVQKNLNTFGQLLKHFGQKAETFGDFLMNLESRSKEKKIQRTHIQTERIDATVILNQAIEIKGIPTVVEHVKVGDLKELSALADDIKNRSQGLAVLSANIGEKSVMVVSVAKKLTTKINANIIVKEVARLISGNGGGRPDFAQAGGNKIKQATGFKKRVLEILERVL